VLKFGIGSTWIMMPGDADRDAWEKHITNYHGERLQAAILGAAHHGSRSFFRYDEDDDPYLDALKKISPKYVVISAPRSEESPFEHPHKDAVKLYADTVGKENVLHTGEKRHSFICDIFRDEKKYTILPDNGDLADEYSIDEEEDDDGGKGSNERNSVGPAIVSTRVDRRPMGNL
jgi:hypothetical protein